MTRPRAYVAGPLHSAPNLAEARHFYELLGEACEAAGWISYLPHLSTDPDWHPTVSPREVFRADIEMVEGSDAVIADIGVPSAGVGGELVLAWHSGTPIVAVMATTQTVSRFVLGLLDTAGAAVIEYSDLDQCRERVAAELNRLAELARR